MQYSLLIPQNCLHYFTSNIMQIIFLIIYQIPLYLFSSPYLKVITTLDPSKQFISYLGIYTPQIIIHGFLVCSPLYCLSCLDKQYIIGSFNLFS